MSIERRKNSRSFALSLTLSLFVLSFGLAATAQGKSGSESGQQKMGGTAGQSATLTASLVDPEKNAREKTATVQVRVTGVKLIDPALTNKRPTKGQGHLHYQVDGGPVIATTTPKLSFHELTSGKHQIVVVLANNDHSPAGPQQALEIIVP